MFSWTESRHTVCRFSSSTILCCLGLSAFLGSCDRFETREVLATVLAVDGKATVVHEANAMPAAQVPLLAVGDRLRTERDGKVMVSLVPGARVVLSRDSELEVEELKIHKLGAAVSHAVRARNAHIRLLRGSICASVVQRRVRPHIRLYVGTPAGTFEASPGTTFYVRVNETVTHVACAGGTVSLGSGGDADAEMLEAGYAREWEKEKANGLPMQVVRDPNLREEVQNALAAARTSEDLEDSRRYIMPGLGQP